MTRDLEDDNYYALKKGSKIPLKWTAPETIFYKKYSTNSDVWSYGMLMYEIWSLGHKPFEEVDTQEVCVVVFGVYICSIYIMSIWSVSDVSTRHEGEWTNGIHLQIDII